MAVRKPIVLIANNLFGELPSGDTIPGGAALPAGSNMQIQFNDGGALGAEAGFEYDKTTNILRVPGYVQSPSGSLTIEAGATGYIQFASGQVVTTAVGSSVSAALTLNSDPGIGIAGVVLETTNASLYLYDDGFIQWNGQDIWHAGNDGTGSSLDADLLDGQEGSHYLARGNHTGTLAVNQGGTGATTLTGYVKGNGTSALTASSTIPNTDITGLGTASTQDTGTSGANVPLLNGANTHSGKTTFTYAGNGGSDSGINIHHSAGAQLGWSVTGQGADGKNWDMVAAGASLVLRAVNDANNSAANAYRVTRSGASISTQEWYAGGSVQMTLTSTGLNATAIGASTPSTGAFTTLSASGSVKSSGATAGIGYATGAGGTVTQATNKSTGVTLNKACGVITMHNAALADKSQASFILTNSAIAADDFLLLKHHATGNLGDYLFQYRCASGSATIWVYNISGWLVTPLITANPICTASAR